MYCFESLRWLALIPMGSGEYQCEKVYPSISPMNGNALQSIGQN